MPDLLLTIHTTRRCYGVLYDYSQDLHLLPGKANLHRSDSQQNTQISADLGRLLDPQDVCSTERWCALIVPLRWRSVALLFGWAGEIEQVERATIRPLPALLARGLRHTWISGVILQQNRFLLLLDVRAIAQSVLRQPFASSAD